MDGTAPRGRPEIDFVLGDYVTAEVRTVNLPITADQPSLARALKRTGYPVERGVRE